ncbi:metallophosphoesterase [Lacticaseibacillus salsurae]|uniref:metallophosphoesterase n=1 Tax=Lacticaseibacillus salsurae TaxID=3367729 RepID=UPI003D9C0314
MKRWVAIIVSLIAMCGFAAALAFCYPQSTDHEPVLSNESKPTLWVTSDTHFIAPSLHDHKHAWQMINGSAAGKDLYDQPIAIHAFVQEALKQKPTAVIITGDVTFNGELASAQSIAKRLEPLQNAGIHVLIIPGNHDIYDGWARKFKGKTQYKTAQISPETWRHIFHDGYQHEASEDADSLSYAINLNQNYQLLMLDDNIYTVQPSNIQPMTGGRLRPSTLNWIRKRLETAHTQHRQTLVFMHHNLYDHNAHSDGWTLNNAPALRKLLAEYKVPVVFSGHIHAQDISADPSGKSPTKEIVSASFAQTPGVYGVVTLTKDTFAYHTQKQNLTPYLTATQRTYPRLINYQRYLEKDFKESQALPIVWQEARDAGLRGDDLSNAATFLAELNWRFFSGTDSGGLATLKEMAGYKVVMGNAQLRPRAQAMLIDHNLPDRKLFLRY